MFLLLTELENRPQSSLKANSIIKEHHIGVTKKIATFVWPHNTMCIVVMCLPLKIKTCIRVDRVGDQWKLNKWFYCSSQVMTNSGISVLIWWILEPIILILTAYFLSNILLYSRIMWCPNVYLLVITTGSRHPQKDSPHYWHLCWPSSAQQVHRISAGQRAAPEGVPF